MRILPTLALIAMACVAATQETEKLDLTRQYKEGAIQKYRVVAKIAQGPGIELKGLIESKTTKTDKDGKAQLDLKCLEYSESAGENAVDSELPAALSTSFDKNNMPEELSVQDKGGIYVAFSVSSYLPAKQLAQGEEFKIDWKSKGGASMTGKGSITEIKTTNGIKIAVVKYKVQVTPAGTPDPADLEVTSEFNVSDGSLIKSSAKGTLSEGDITITVDLAK